MDKRCCLGPRLTLSLCSLLLLPTYDAIGGGGGGECFVSTTKIYAALGTNGRIIYLFCTSFGEEFAKRRGEECGEGILYGTGKRIKDKSRRCD